MSLIPHEFIFRGDLSALGPFHSQVFVDALAGGEIVSYYVEAEGVSGFSGDWYFGLKKNGVDILTAAERPQITAGDLEVEVTGLTEAVSFRDRLVPTVDERGAGTITGPVTVIVWIKPTEKATPLDADTVAITDSAASGATKRLSWANIKATLLTYFDTLYVALAGNQTIGGIKTFSSSPIVPTPTGSTDAANKSYVDAGIAGLAWKQRVRAATAIAGTLASSFENGDTIDGVVLATGDRILIKDQAAGTENGIYTVNAAGAPTRATDADSGTELVNASVYASEGTANGDKQFVCTTDSPIAVGATSITFVEFSSGGAAALPDLIDVDDFAAPQAGAMLVGNGTSWEDNYQAGNAQAKILLDDVAQQVVIGDVDNLGNNTYLMVDDTAQKVISTKKIEVPDVAYGAGWNADLSVPTKNAVYDKVETLMPKSGGTFTGDIIVPDEAYDATLWDGNLEAPTKNAVRDKIEALVLGGGGYTDEQAQDAIGVMLVDTATIDLTYTDATPELKADVIDDSITFAKMQNIATAKLLGRSTAEPGDVEELSAATARTLLGLVIGTNVQAYDAALTALSNALSDLADPAANAILYWNDSTNRFEFLTAGTNITISGGTIAASGGGGGGMTWTEVTGTSQAAAVDNGYITNNAALVTVTLPAVAAVGKVVSVVGSGAGGWRIAQNASQEVKWTAGGVDGFDETTAGTGGFLESTDRYDSIELICLVANNTWGVKLSKGIINVT